MSTLLEALTEQLGGDNLKQIAGQVGADERQTGAALATALPTLLGALAKNSTQPDGAAALHRALEKDHDGAILDKLPGFLRQPDAGPGEGILRHLLGGRQQSVEKSLSKTTGMSNASVGKLLATLAPVVMGALGRQQRQRSMNAANLTSFLGEERQGIEKQAPKAMSAISSLLDADGDGDVDLSDLAQKGVGMLGKMFGRN